MNKKNMVCIILVIILIAIIVGITLYFINRKTYELKLPSLEKIESISIEQNTNKKVISKQSEIKEILDNISNLNTITQEESIQDAPINSENGIKVDFNLKEMEISTIFIYQKNNKYYIEQPYNGIYKISKDAYDSLLNDAIQTEQISEQYYKNKLEGLPKELSVQEAVNRGYFVYDGKNNKIYNKQVLDRFVENTKVQATNRVEDEMTIAIYTINSEPILYHISYQEKGYVLVTDATRIKTVEMEFLPKEYYEITVNRDIPKEYYSITVNKDEGVNAVSILLTVYKDEPEAKQYQDIEIARYLLDAQIQ